MKIGLIGYGKMGKAVETVALAQGHKIVAHISSNNTEDFALLKNADVAIEFTNPASVVSNLFKCLELGIPVVTGSTGWQNQLSTVEKLFRENDGALIHASNFSIGVNIFMELNAVLAKHMNEQLQYSTVLREIHHTEKIDAPSGTAITLANDIIAHLNRKTEWVNNYPHSDNQLEIVSERLPNVPGTHSVCYESEADQICITHTAKNRIGFAEGALLAANWIQGKKGVFTMKDILNLNTNK